MTHAFYVSLAYGITAVIVAALIGWTWLDGRSRKKEMAMLEAAGIRRRSAMARPEARQ